MRIGRYSLSWSWGLAFDALLVALLLGTLWLRHENDAAHRAAIDVAVAAQAQMQKDVEAAQQAAVASQKGLLNLASSTWAAGCLEEDPAEWFERVGVWHQWAQEAAPRWRALARPWCRGVQAQGGLPPGTH